MSLDFKTLRMATQVRELAIQGVTLKNTFKDMEEVWLALHTADKRSLIVDQIGTRTKYQEVTQYAVKLIKYMNSIVGMDMFPVVYQDPTSTHWKLDSTLLNIAGHKVIDHEHLYRLILINIYGISDDIISYALNPTTEGLRQYIKKVYDVDFGESEGASESVTIEQTEKALVEFLAGSDYKLY